MSNLSAEDEKNVLDVLNLIGPTLQQAITDGVAKAFQMADERHQWEHVAAGSPPAMQAIPHPYIMDQLTWSTAYGAALTSGKDEHVSASDADLAVTYFRMRFPK